MATRPGSKASQGNVENFSRTLRALLNRYVATHSGSSVSAVPQLVEAYNTRPHSATGKAPADFAEADVDMEQTIARRQAVPYVQALLVLRHVAHARARTRSKSWARARRVEQGHGRGGGQERAERASAGRPAVGMIPRDLRILHVAAPAGNAR